MERAGVDSTGNQRRGKAAKESQRGDVIRREPEARTRRGTAAGERTVAHRIAEGSPESERKGGRREGAEGTKRAGWSRSGVAAMDGPRTDGPRQGWIGGDGQDAIDQGSGGRAAMDAKGV